MVSFIVDMVGFSIAEGSIYGGFVVFIGRMNFKNEIIFPTSKIRLLASKIAFFRLMRQ